MSALRRVLQEVRYSYVTITCVYIHRSASHCCSLQEFNGVITLDINHDMSATATVGVNNDKRLIALHMYSLCVSVSWHGVV